MSIEPAEHARLHGYVRALAQVSDIDECDLGFHVLKRRWVVEREPYWLR